MPSLTLSNVERETLGEALLVYIFRALNKPSKTSYFHTRLIDVLIKSAKASFHVSKAVSWANGTSYLQQFDRRCRLDDHPDAPPFAVTAVFSGNESFVFLSKAGIDRIKTMTRDKRRQLEALAAALFPDFEAIRGSGKLFSGAEVVPENKGFLAPPDKREVERDSVKPAAVRAEPALSALTQKLEEIFSDPELTPLERDELGKDVEDVILGRLEIEQPLISVELILRVLKRSLARLSEKFGSKIVDNLIHKALAGIAGITPLLDAA